MNSASKSPPRPTPPAGRRSVTSIDVARLAEVSQSAVSRSFTPGASVAPETRARVLDAARKLGYRPNAIASTLSTRRSRMIAVVLSNLQNQFYPVVVEALSQRLQKDGYHVLLFVTETEDADELLVELLRYQVDGIVMASTHLSSGLAQQIADARIPVVMFNRTSNKGRISTVSSDNLSGGRAVAHFLADGGHQRVAYIAGAEDSSTNHDREEGLRAGLDLNAGGTLARDLDELYTYLTMRLTLAHIRNDEAMLDECQRLIQPLREAWQSIGPAARALQPAQGGR